MRVFVVSTAVALLAASQTTLAGPIPTLLEGIQDKCNPYDTTCKAAGPFLHHLADSAQTFERLTQQDGLATGPSPGLLADPSLQDYGSTMPSMPPSYGSKGRLQAPIADEDEYIDDDDDDFEEEPAYQGSGGSSSPKRSVTSPDDKISIPMEGPSPVPSMDFAGDSQDDDFGFDDDDDAEADNSTSIVDTTLSESNSSLTVLDAPGVDDATNSSIVPPLNLNVSAPLPNGTTTGESHIDVQKDGALAEHKTILDRLCLIVIASAGAIFLL